MVNRTNTLSSQALSMSPRTAVNRRGLLQTAGAVSVSAALGRMPWLTARRRRAVRRRPAGAKLGGQADALGAAHAGRGRPGQVRPAVLARLLQAHDAPTRSASAPAAAWPITRRRSRSITAAHGWASATCSANWSPAAASWAWSSSPARIPHATYDDVQAAHPDWIAVDADGQAAPALGLAGDVGDLRARSLQLRVHDRGEEGDHVALPGGRHLHQPLGRLRDVLLRALPEELPRRRRGTSCPARTTRRIRRGALTSSGVSNGSSTCGVSGTPRSARSIPTPASSRTPAAARPVRSTCSGSANWRPRSSPTGRPAAG